MARLGIDGSVRADAGDYVYPVDSNVSPASKLNAVTDRDVDLNVQIDEFGNAVNEMMVRWTNRIASDEARPYRELPTLEKNTTLGMYFRLYVPERSRLEAVSGGTEAPITSAAEIAEDAGRQVISNYFRIPPGSARLSYRWISPYPADLGEDGIATYRLTVQKQPGLRSGTLRIKITIPAGATIAESTPESVVAGESATIKTSFDRDIVVVIRYRLAGIVR
jgi:hypothetical protein